MKTILIIIFTFFYTNAFCQVSAEQSLDRIEKNQAWMKSRLSTYDKAIATLESKVSAPLPKSLPFPPTHPDLVQVNVSDMTAILSSEAKPAGVSVESIVDLTSSNEKVGARPPSTQLEPSIQKPVAKNTIPDSPFESALKGIEEKSKYYYKFIFYGLALIFLTFLLISSFFFFIRKKPKKLLKIDNEEVSPDLLYDLFIQKFKFSIANSLQLKSNGIPENLKPSLIKTPFGRWLMGVASADDKHSVAMAFAQSTHATLIDPYQTKFSMQLLFAAAFSFLSETQADLLENK